MWRSCGAPVVLLWCNCSITLLLLCVTVVLVCVLSLQAVVDVWQMFQTEFLQLWDQHSHQGDAYPATLFGGSVKQGQQVHQACLLALKILPSTTLDLYTSS